MATLDLAFLIIYALLLLATIVISLLHGIHRLAWLGWGYLAVFCGLKVASNALQLDAPRTGGITATTTAVAVLICTIALVPLTLAVAFVLRTALSYACHPGARVPRHRTFDCILSAAFHVLAGIAMVFLATGAWELATRPAGVTPPTPPARPPRGESHAGAGAMVLMLSIVLICAVAVIGYKDVGRYHYLSHSHSHPGQDRDRDRRRRRLGCRLVLAAGAAGFLLAFRVGGGLHWFFGRGPEANPVTGTLALRLALSTLPETLAALALVVGGVVTWDMAR